MIDNPRSPRVRAVAKLAKKSRRHDAGLFLVEGPQAVREALTHRPDGAGEVFMTEAAMAKHGDLKKLATAAGIPIEPVTEDVLKQMADTPTPQGVVAVHQMSTLTLQSAIKESPQLVVILDQVSDPGNAGTIIRVAVAAGADAVIVTDDSVDIYNPKVVRSTTGSLFHIPVVRGVSVKKALNAMHKAGCQVLAADMSGEPLPALAKKGVLAKPTAWLFGNEAHGLGDKALAHADQVVSIPQYGPVESMNLATAASVCVFQSAFAQHPDGPPVSEADS